MSSSSALASINKIHINNSTKMTLSDRFTAFSAQPKIQPRTSRRRSVDSPVNRVASIANRRLLKQLAQKHTREAALKLKRRSMKPRAPPSAAYNRVSNGVPLKRGAIKALRLGPSGRLMKANSITNVATMEADFLGRAPRRSNSASRISERIGGGRRNEAPFGGGGAARRVGRPVWRTNSQMNFNRTPPPRMRSRSRSRTRRAVAVLPPTSSQQGIGQRMALRSLRSTSRPRALARSRSRSGRFDGVRPLRLADARGAHSVPITSRLGVRRSAAPAGRSRSVSRGRSVAGRRPLRDGIAIGRIQKRRNSVKPVTARGATLANSLQNRINRSRGRYTSIRSAPPANQRLNAQFPKSRGITTMRGRARSRSRPNNRTSQRNGGVAARGRATVNRKPRGTQPSARGRGGAVRGGTRRGRSQQRGAAGAGGAQRNGQQEQQQRRGRSRSRGRGSVRGGRQLGKDKPDVKREDLDKELDQYMSSTKASDGLFS